MRSDYDDLITTPTGRPAPAHEIIDSAKVDALALSMIKDGWIGPPILMDGEQAITGAHRIAAADWAGIDIPRIQICELATLYGIDWAELHTEGNWYRATIALADLLPRDLVDELGIDLH